MHNHAEGTDPFDDFARRDLEEKGVEPKKAREVVEDSYPPPGPDLPPSERERRTCRFCGQDVVDGSFEAGAPPEHRPAWMTPEGDYGCDPSPETHPDEGVGAHAVTEEEERAARAWARENNPPAEAAPRPWWIDEDDPSVVFAGNRDWAYLIQAPGESAQEIRANAALIVRAVNAHDELVEALDTLLRQYRLERDQIAGTDQYEEQARAALARARGES